MKTFLSILILLCILFYGCSNKYYVTKWRLEPSGINADTIALYQKEKIVKNKYVRVFGDSVKILKSDLDSLLNNWAKYHWPPVILNNVSLTIDAKSLVNNISVYKVSIQSDTLFNEDVAHVIWYSPKYGIIIKMRKVALLTNDFYSLVAIKNKSSNIYKDIDFEKLSGQVYADTILFRRR